jgi:diguanylate cyclase (GGDEF)-like protein
VNPPHGPRSIEVIMHARDLMMGGQSREAAALLTRYLPVLGGYDRALASVMRVPAVFNAGTDAELATAIDEAFAEVQSQSNPLLHGKLHAVAALAAHRRGDLHQTVTHLVQGARALRQIDEADQFTPWAWHDLAMAYSYSGFHGYAISAIQRAREIAGEAGMSEELFDAPGIRLRVATWRDHQGDAESSVRVLHDIAADLARHLRAGTVERLRPSARVSYGYAVARLNALGQPSDVDPLPLFRFAQKGTRIHQLVTLGEACLAIGGGLPVEALTRLASAEVSPETLGPAEVSRLRALAYLRMGDHRAAYDADRQAFRVASAYGEQLREACVEGMAARLEHEDLRRTMERYADEALTDPLTGLPNRRYLERYVAGMIERGDPVVVGVCDLDGFKAVNTVHGHLTGDLVLRRVGDIIMRILRRGDFVARYGGDEFVVVLPRTSLGEAGEVAERIVLAVGAADWSGMVPGTPVGVSIGWAQVSGPRRDLRQALNEAFEAADRAMLDAKHLSRAS